MAAGYCQDRALSGGECAQVLYISQLQFWHAVTCPARRTKFPTAGLTTGEKCKSPGCPRARRIVFKLFPTPIYKAAASFSPFWQSASAPSGVPAEGRVLVVQAVALASFQFA